jgi:transcription elongation factor Elf1
VSAGFRCPTCDTENIVGLERTNSGVDEITCGDCGMHFEVEYR